MRLQQAATGRPRRAAPLALATIALAFAGCGGSNQRGVDNSSTRSGGVGPTATRSTSASTTPATTQPGKAPVSNAVLPSGFCSVLGQVGPLIAPNDRPNNGKSGPLSEGDLNFRSAADPTVKFKSGVDCVLSNPGSPNVEAHSVAAFVLSRRVSPEDAGQLLFSGTTNAESVALPGTSWALLGGSDPLYVTMEKGSTIVQLIGAETNDRSADRAHMLQAARIVLSKLS